MRRTTAIFGFLPALLLAACAAKPNAYDVTVTNKIDKPVTVWITMDHGPWETGWAPPEEIATETTTNKVIGGVVVQPGVTVVAKLSGKTSPENPAVLRVYQATTLNSILAISRGDPQRTESVLYPGKTQVDVVMDKNELSTDLHHVDAPPPN